MSLGGGGTRRTTPLVRLRSWLWGRSVPSTIPLLSLLFPGILAAQSLITIPPQQCVWRTGDNPAWAAPNLDESGWQPYTKWHPDPDQAHMWIRCHADLGALRSDSSPALQVNFYAAYALYLDGNQIGGAGDLRSGYFSLNVIRTYPLISAQIPDQPAPRCVLGGLPSTRT
jgi:hypothetical protein